jgi:hypothetical protein
MSHSETLAYVDSEDLRSFKERMELNINSLVDSYESLIKQFNDIVDSGWDDENQQIFEEELDEIKKELLERIIDFKESSGEFLDKKIVIIEEYCSFDFKK